MAPIPGTGTSLRGSLSSLALIFLSFFMGVPLPSKDTKSCWQQSSGRLWFTGKTLRSCSWAFIHHAEKGTFKSCWRVITWLLTCSRVRIASHKPWFKLHLEEKPQCVFLENHRMCFGWFSLFAVLNPSSRSTFVFNFPLCLKVPCGVL